jgi:hypothetical protein
MFEQLREHSAILVSGPQRSGTRICTKMVAHDTGHKFVDETELKWLFIGKSIDDKPDWDNIKNITVASMQRHIDNNKHFVIHCPPFMPWLHLVKGAFLVVMQRPINEIMASAHRIQWKKSRQELEYNKIGYTRFGSKKSTLTKTNKPLAELKYEEWQGQKRGIDNFREVEYKSLATHELYIPKNDRTKFRWNQTL